MHVQGCAHAQGYMHVREIPEKVLSSRPLLTESLHKQKVKAKVKLSTACLSVEDMPPRGTQSPFAECEIYWFQVFKETSVQSLAACYAS